MTALLRRMPVRKQRWKYECRQMEEATAVVVFVLF